MKGLIYAMVQQAKKPFEFLPDDFPTPTLPPGTAGFLFGHLTGVISGLAAAATVAVLVSIARAERKRCQALAGEA